MKINNESYQITDLGSTASKALIIGIVGLAATLAGYFIDTTQLFYSYLVAYMFWLSIALGGLFFTMLHHLVGAKWSIVLRKFSEAAMSTFPLLAILIIPILLGLNDLYQWSDADLVASDHLLQKKSSYLNPTFFIIRIVVYFVVWTLLAWILKKASDLQDSGSQEKFLKLKRFSAPGMVLFAITLTLASFDLLMSLDAHWYSTIFGAYYFSGAVVAILGLIILVALNLKKKEILSEKIGVNHYHDLGKLMFGFVVFWAYMAFSQYFLIWYANIPEETIWYTHRWVGSWKAVSLVIVFGNFAVPFLLMIPRAAKRNMGILKFMAIWLLFMHWIDLYWLTMPVLHHHGAHLHWLDLTTMVGIGGLFLWFFWKRFSASPVIPVKDPGLLESINLKNS